MPTLVYEGSVKRVWELNDPLNSDQLEFEYTDAYSVFDWGRMPDVLRGKGEALAAMGKYFFGRIGDPKTWMNIRGSRWLASQDLAPSVRQLIETELSTLCVEGMPHHCIERTGPTRLRVKRVEVCPPETVQLGNQILHLYPRVHGSIEEGNRLIPLEVVFRLGMPSGSSLKDRLTPEYCRQLGLKTPPKEGERFSVPIVEFFTKLEETDRFLSWEQALNYAGLSIHQFTTIVARSMLLAICLSEIFEKTGLELWDGKFEFAVLDGDVAVVDSIGPDELRLLDPGSGIQISKEFLRNYYRETPWLQAVKKAKSSGDIRNWKQRVLDTVGAPPGLVAEYKEAAECLYPSLALALTGENPSGLGIDLKSMIQRVQECTRP